MCYFAPLKVLEVYMYVNSNTAYRGEKNCYKKVKILCFILL